MASKDVTFSVRITDEGSLKRVIVDAQEFKDVIKNVTNEVEGLKTKLINFTQFSDMVDQVSNSFLQLTGFIKNLTDTYAVQIEAETQLATTMRNNMDATDADIESIKRLCAAQQELGIIGDEVQLAGAQELATYLEHKSTLEKLIPVLNDMNAQQYGLNATTQSSVTIATMLGKVMEGQTGALSRYGYSFDAAQEQVLKFGTEEERVAVLVDVVTSAVGGMNAELARTDVGRQKQLENTIGDLKEKIGGLISPAMNACAVIDQIAGAAAGISKLAKGFDYAIGFVKSLTASCKLLNVAMKATFIASGIGLAILTITEIISALSTSTEDATEQFQNLKQATDEYTNKAAEVRANINSEIESLGKLIASHGNEEDAVNRLNNTYGQVFGTYQTASDWYEILTQQSENYVKQVGYEAQARLLATKIAEKQIQLDSSKAEREKILANSNIKSNPSYWDMKYGNAVGLSSKDDKRYKELEKNEKSLTEELGKLQNQLEIAKQGISDAKSSLSNVLSEPVSTPINLMNTESVKNELAQIESELDKTLSPEKISGLVSRKKELEARLKELNKLTGRTDGTKVVQNKKAEEKAEEAYVSIKKDEITTFQELDAEINYQHKLLMTANADERKGIAETIIDLESMRDEWEKIIGLKQESVKTVEEEVLALKEDATTLKDYENNVRYYTEQLQNATAAEAAGINANIKMWQDLADSIRNAGDEIEETASKSVNFKDGFGSVVGLGDGIDRLSESLRGNGDAWQTAVSAVESAIQIYDGIQSVIGIIQALTGANTAATAATTASSVAEVTAATTKTATTTAEITASAGLTAATKLEAAAFRELAASEFMAAHAYIPFAGFGIAAGFIGAMQGLIAATAIPFANGGLLYGPTLALMGEYAGARTNPEVVAPLDKLRSLIGDASGGKMNGKVEFKIKRGNLVGVMENDARHRQRV